MSCLMVDDLVYDTEFHHKVNWIPWTYLDLQGLEWRIIGKVTKEKRKHKQPILFPGWHEWQQKTLVPTSLSWAKHPSTINRKQDQIIFGVWVTEFQIPGLFFWEKVSDPWMKALPSIIHPALLQRTYSNPVVQFR